MGITSEYTTNMVKLQTQKIWNQLELRDSSEKRLPLIPSIVCINLVYNLQIQLDNFEKMVPPKHYKMKREG